MLDVFSVYFINLSDGTEFNSAAQRQAMDKLLALNEIELSWFRVLSSRPLENTQGEAYMGDSGGFGYSGVGYTKVSPDYHPSFSECSRALFYFFDYFKAKNLSLPTTYETIGEIYQFTGIIRLKGILDCISLAKNPRLQAQYLAEIPRNIPMATAQLRSGYSLVHEGMYLRKDHRFANRLKVMLPEKELDPYLISRKEFEQLNFDASHEDNSDYLPALWFFKGIYLRYLAYNVSPENFVKGLAEWERRITAKYLQDGQEQIEKHWKDLKKFALSFPSRMEKEKTKNYTADAFVQEKIKKEALQKKLYPVEDLDNLPVPDSEKEEMESAVQRLNNLITPYASLSGKELEEAANLCKQNLQTGKIDIVESLALLREIYYRLSGQQQWLRLEQVIIVLLALKENRLYQVETAEGKTFIIQLVALLQALQDKKVDVMTHNEKLASDSFNSIRAVAALLKLQVASKGQESEKIQVADIFYSDIAAAVIRNLSAQLQEASGEEIAHRKAEQVLVDEVDNIAIDIQASTTMQLSVSDEQIEADDELEEFLFALNDAVVALIEEMSYSPGMEIERQRQKIKEKTQHLPYYVKHCAENTVRLDYWISAAFTRAHPTKGLKNGSDYVLQKDNRAKNEQMIVRIVHKETTGRVDKISQWGSGVHQCVAAWEKKQNPALSVKVPAISRVVAEGDISNYLQQYPSRSGFTGSLGDEPVIQEIQSVLALDTEPVLMPRARRPEAANSDWPVIIQQDKPVKQYRRAYHFPPQLYENRADHFVSLLNAVRAAYEACFSTIIFFNTIEECEQFATFMQRNAVNSIQILDDQNPLDEEDASDYRPTEATVISRASEPGMVTLTTAAGGRGTDFQKIDIGIVAKPGLKRVIEQKKGRLARNMDLGVTYEIYCKDDIESRSKMSNAKSNGFRFFVEHAEHEKQIQQIRQIQEKRSLREFKQSMQQIFMRELKKSDQKEPLSQAWSNFLSEVDLTWDNRKNETENFETMAIIWEECFAKTSWQNDPFSSIDKDESKGQDLAC